MEYREKYEGWLSDPYFDEATKEELRGIAEDDNEIKERFYKDLEFGTAGLRGIIGAGTYEYLYGKEGDPGACELYHQQGRTEEGRGDRV